jgi:hypothetical protein
VGTFLQLHETIVLQKKGKRQNIEQTNYIFTILHLHLHLACLIFLYIRTIRRDEPHGSLADLNEVHIVYKAVYS